MSCGHWNRRSKSRRQNLMPRSLSHRGPRGCSDHSSGAFLPRRRGAPWVSLRGCMGLLCPLTCRAGRAAGGSVAAKLGQCCCCIRGLTQSRRPRAVVLKGLTDHRPQNVLDSFIGKVDLLGQGLWAWAPRTALLVSRPQRLRTPQD